MDNRIANDMISSGMIPSGEKKKEDLSRTQYGSAPSPNKLMDAYKSMYEHHQKDKDGNTIPHEGEELNEALPLVPMLGKVATGAAKVFSKVKTIAKNPVVRQQVVGGAVNKMNEPKEKVNKSGVVTAGADLFDIVKGKLLDEGLSEEEIKDIMLTLTPDEILNEISAETALAASKARDVQAGKLKGPENTEKRKELRDKASQNYDRAVQKRQSGFVKNTASPQGPSRIPTSGM
jgi:hypothetical protein